MTTPAEPNERDWDAEFAAITGHLDDIAVDEPPRARGANRDTFTSTSREADRRGARDSHDGRRTFTPSPDAGASPPSSDSPVPGFRPQWRVPDHGPDADEPHPTAPGNPAASHDDPLSDETQPSDDDGTFVPATPQPLESDDPATVIMLGCFVVGPLWLLYLALFDRDTAAMWWALAALTLVTGFVLAVARQPRARDDGDDGARV